jgi:hypothetical protein
MRQTPPTLPKSGAVATVAMRATAVATTTVRAMVVTMAARAAVRATAAATVAMTVTVATVAARAKAARRQWQHQGQWHSATGLNISIDS